MIYKEKRWIYESEYNKSLYKKKFSHLSQSLIIYFLFLSIPFSFVGIGATFFIYFDEIFDFIASGTHTSQEITQYILYFLFSNEILTYMIQIAASILAAFMAVTYYKSKHKTEYLSPFKSSADYANNSRLFTFITIGATLAAEYIINYTIYLLEYFGIISTSEGTSMFPESAAGIILYFIATVIVAPVVEEYFYRGVLFKELSFYGMRFAVVFSSVIFGLMHRSAPLFFFAAAFGIFNCVLYSKTNSLFYPIIAHMTINFISFIESFMINYHQSIFPSFYYIISALSFFAALLFTIILHKKKQSFRISDSDRYYIKSKTKFKSMFNIALILLLVFTFISPLVTYIFDLL